MKYEIVYKVIKLIDQDVKNCKDSLIKYDLMNFVHSLYEVASRQRAQDKNATIVKCEG